MTTGSRFDYRVAFSRTVGWITHHEQSLLRTKRVAIAGLGGVGGSHLLTLSRLGVGAFSISDFDSFELANFNRQAGASFSTLGHPKLDVLMSMALDINPDAEINAFPEGVTESNIADFLSGADVFLDGLDFFALEIRRKVFAACHELGIPAVTAAPLGMGVAILNFMPGKMSFEEYFRLEGRSEREQLIRFLLGLSPAMLQRGYLVDTSAVDFEAHRGPSTPMACELCAGVAATQILKILLDRKSVIAVPRGLQFDPYREKLVRTWRPWGNRNPLQKLGLMIAGRQISRMGEQESKPDAETKIRPVDSILEQARWAPSGDNTQPWRFEIRGEDHIVIHGHDTREHCVYDLQGHASQLSLGALLENIRLAAGREGFRVSTERRVDVPETHPVFDIRLVPDANIEPDPLALFITERTVQRRAMRLADLQDLQRHTLELALPEGYRVCWFEGILGRSKAVRLVFKSAGLRYVLPEAYPTHRDVIDWENVDYSTDRIPANAVGLDRLTLRLTHWAMQSWARVKFLNRYLGGTLLPRLQLDVIPGLFSSAYFVLLADKRPRSIDDFVTAGAAMQRFWLKASSLSLFVQPVMTPLIFHEYVRDNVSFSTYPGMARRAQEVSDELKSLLGNDTDQGVFMGRIGQGEFPAARSVRRPLNELIIGDSEKTT